MALFKVKQVFTIESRLLLVLAGDIEQGKARLGQLAVVRGTSPGFSQRVHGVEFVDGLGKSALIGLTFKAEDKPQLETWLTLPLTNATVTLTDLVQPTVSEGS